MCPQTLLELLCMPETLDVREYSEYSGLKNRRSTMQLSWNATSLGLVMNMS